MFDHLKKCAQRLPYPLFLRLFHLVHSRRELQRASAAARRAKAPLLTCETLRARKRSDTLFVLGSGTSINRITADRWQGIARHDSLGLNFWILHPFVPSYYMFESFALETYPEAARIMLKAFEVRAEDYRDTVKIVTETHRRGRQVLEEIDANFRSNLYAALSIPAPARTITELDYALRFLEARQMFSPNEGCSRLLKYAASLTTALTLAVKVNYRRVVLCGVDLHDQRYFFQDPEFYPETAHLEIEPREQKHHIETAGEWRLPATDVIALLKQRYFDPMGREIYVENQRSGLWPKIAEAPPEVFAAI